jgi:hypothetical protein
MLLGSQARKGIVSKKKVKLGLMWHADVDIWFQIRPVCFIKVENVLYFDKCTSLVQNRLLKSEV